MKRKELKVALLENDAWGSLLNAKKEQCVNKQQILFDSKKNRRKEILFDCKKNKRKEQCVNKQQTLFECVLASSTASSFGQEVVQEEKIGIDKLLFEHLKEESKRQREKINKNEKKINKKWIFECKNLQETRSFMRKC